MTEAAEIIKRRKGEIMEVWAEEVRNSVKGAKFATDLVLLNHLPDLLNDLRHVLETYENFDALQEKQDFQKLFKNSIGHGRHRSASFGYSLDQIIREYIIFHKVITDILISEGAYTSEISIVLKYAVENSILFASSAFNSSINEMRQKLIRILAHDLRNPISAAYLAVDMVDHKDGPERFEKIKEMTLNSLKRAVELIESLLETIAIEAGEGMTVNFAEVDLMEYIESLHYEASEIYSNEIKLEVEGDKKIHGIFDGAMIRRVLENFVNNALKYGDRETPITIWVKNSEKFVSITVHNHGEPIPEEKRKVIFQFLNTDGNRGIGDLKSWGIGLALVKAVVEAHGGELKVDSSEEEGTSFTVVLNKFKNKPGRIKAALSF